MVRVPFFVGGDLLKNKLKLFFVICFCLVPSFGTFAEDSVVNKPVVESGTKDEKGCYTSGMLICLNETSGYAHRFTLSGSNLYAVVVDDNHYSICGSNVKYTFEYRDSYDKDFIAWENSSFSGSKSVAGKGTLYGSIPIFDKNKEGYEDAVKRYLENGDCSGAENVYDVSQPTQDDSVELPKNLRTYGNVFEEAIEGTSISSMTPRYNAMTVRWDPPDDIQSYSYDVKIQVTYSKCTGVVTGRVPDLTKTETTSAEMVVTDYPYANRGTYDLTTGKEIARGDNQPEDYVILHIRGAQTP